MGGPNRLRNGAQFISRVRQARKKSQAGGAHRAGVPQRTSFDLAAASNGRGTRLE